MVGKQRRVVLHAHILLAAESAAHHGRRHAYALKRKPEHIRAFVLRLINALVGADDVHDAALGIGYGAFRLQKRVLRKGNAVVVGHHIFAVFDDFVRVAAF
jgi:hypothetical protein